MKKIVFALLFLLQSVYIFSMFKESEYVIALSGMEPKALPKKLSQLDINEQAIDNLAFYQCKGYLAFLVRQLTQSQHQILITAQDEQAFRSGNFSVLGLDICGDGNLKDPATSTRDLGWYALSNNAQGIISRKKLEPTGPDGSDQNSTRDWWIKFVTVRNAIDVIKRSESPDANAQLRALIDTAGPVFDSVHSIDIAHTNAIRSLSGIVSCYYEHTPPPSKKESSCIIS